MIIFALILELQNQPYYGPKEAASGGFSYQLVQNQKYFFSNII